MKISAVLVSYRSASLACEAIADLRAEAKRSRLALEVLAVVNSGDPAEASELEPSADRVFLPGRNLGYAGGLNLGLAAATGDLLLLSNPDVRLVPGALGALAAATADLGLGAAGPVFFLDPERRILIPPFDEPHPFALARRRLARDPARASRLLRRDLKRFLALVAAARDGTTVETSALAGALLAVTRATLDRVGPFDEAYALYYEENDFERRLRRLGGKLVVAGGAHVVHRFGRSTRTEPRAQTWFAESEGRYFSAHFGRWGERALAALARAEAWPLPPPHLLPDATIRWSAPGGPAAVLVSNIPEMRPFALAEIGKGETSWQAPDAFLRDMEDGEPWFLRAVSLPSGETLAEGTILKPLRTGGV